MSEVLVMGKTLDGQFTRPLPIDKLVELIMQQLQVDSIYEMTPIDGSFAVNLVGKVNIQIIPVSHTSLKAPSIPVEQFSDDTPSEPIPMQPKPPIEQSGSFKPKYKGKPAGRMEITSVMSNPQENI